LDILINNVVYARITNPSGLATASIVGLNGGFVNKSSIDITATNVPTTNIVITVPTSIFTNTNTISLSFTASNDDFSIDNIYVATTSFSCDVDGDGIPNSLDLDSDGDGCSDAKEARVPGTLTSGTVVNLVDNNAGAGTATSTTANFANSIASGPYGTNGFANSLETSLENGVGNYTSTYSTYAIDKTTELCTDSDSDGIPDTLDLDDDNDGVLDKTEDICQYIFLETFGNTLPYSTLPLDNTPDDVNGNMLMGNNITSTKIVYTKTITGLTVGEQYEFSAFIANPITSLGTSSNLTLRVKNAANAILSSVNTGNILQGNFNWLKYSIVLSAPATSVIFEIQTNTAGNNNTGEDFLIDDIGVKKVGCEDLDGDGILNRLDLDSDGDGCPDAKESGVNGTLTSGTLINTTNNSNSGVFSTTGVANSIAAGPYGTNGLANGVETSVDAGTISYTNNYNRYALDKNINFCIDSDGDGVPDPVDIDDDNDGIRDYIEQGSCPLISSTGLTFTGSTNSVRFNGNSISAVSTSNGVWQTAYSNQSLALPIHLEFRDNGFANYTMFGLLPESGTKTLNNYTDDAYKQYFNNTNAQGYYPNTGTTPSLGFPGNTTLVPGELWQMDIDIFGFVTVTRNGTLYKSFQGVNSNYNVAISTYNDANNSPRLFSDIVINAKSVTISGTTTNCTELDTDNDGVPNRLDLDSDGDGCTDAVESNITADLTSGNVVNGSIGSTTTVSTNKAILVGPYGTNGLSNNAETSVDNGITFYNPSYVYANNANISACLDTDTDGVPDMVDVDDDNDGVPDFTESRSCTDLNNLTFNGLATLTRTASTITASAPSNGTWQNAYSNENFRLPIHLEFKSSQTVPDAMLGLLPRFGSKVTSNYTDDAYKIYFPNTSTYGYLPNTGTNPTSWNPTAVANSVTQTPQNLGELWEMDIDLNGYVIVKRGGRIYRQFQGIKSDYNLAISTPNQGSATFVRTFTDVKLIAANISSNAGVITPCTELDTDADGTPNRLDLDSDGDGCSDAKEAGVPGITTTTSAPFGANGFANNIELGVETGSMSYTSTYAYAINNSISLCNDNDGDGVPDLVDIDDDNDGIIDYDEQVSCPTLTGLIFNNSGKAVLTNNSITTNNASVWINNYSNQRLSLPIHLEYNLADVNGSSFIGFIPVNYNKVLSTNNYTDEAYKMYHSNGTYYGQMPTQWTPGATTQNVGDFFEIDININGVVTVKQNSSIIRTFNGATTDYFFTLTSYNYRSYANVKLLASSVDGVVCNQLDTDNDGRPNYLDTDSDGDGCNDAVEAGSARVGTSIPFVGTYGSNGLINTKETITSGVETGKINYTLNYKNAIASNLNGCTDSDGDGVPDLIDVDDDNDGVTDFTESRSCPLLSNLTMTTLSGGGIVPTFRENIQNNTFNISMTSTNANWNNSYSTQSFSLPIHLEYRTNNLAEGMIGFIPTYGQKSVLNTYTDEAIRYYHSSIYAYGQMPNAWTLGATTGTISDFYELDIDVNGFMTAKKNGVVLRSYQASKGEYNFVLSCAGATTRVFSDVKLIANSTLNGNSNILCNADVDSDGDGIPNRLDIDSDGDGCNDALETGAANPGTIVPLTGNFGANGLLNTLETSTDVGTISYTSTYFNTVTSANCFACEANFGVAIRNDGYNGVFCPGTTYTMRAPAQSPLNDFSFQWQKNGVDIVGANAAVYSTNTAVAGDVFRVRVTQISTGVRSFLLPYIDWPMNVKRMAEGTGNTMGYINGRNIYVWGLNDNGQIPSSSTSNNVSPILMPKTGSLLYADSITFIGFTAYSGYALTTTGKLHVWGKSSSTTIMNGTGVVQNDPIELTQISKLLICTRLMKT